MRYRNIQTENRNGCKIRSRSCCFLRNFLFPHGAQAPPAGAGSPRLLQFLPEAGNVRGFRAVAAGIADICKRGADIPDKGRAW